MPPREADIFYAGKCAAIRDIMEGKTAGAVLENAIHRRALLGCKELKGLRFPGRD